MSLEKLKKRKTWLEGLVESAKKGGVADDDETLTNLSDMLKGIVTEISIFDVSDDDKRRRKGDRKGGYKEEPEEKGGGYWSWPWD